MKQAITRCEKCGKEENGVHDKRSCPRCQASSAMQFVRWIETPIAQTVPFGGITGEKWS